MNNQSELQVIHQPVKHHIQFNIKNTLSFSTKIMDAMSLVTIATIYTYLISVGYYMGIVFLTIPLIFLLIINSNNLIFIRNNRKMEYWLITNNIFKKYLFIISLSLIFILLVAILFSDRTITFLFDNWKTKFNNLLDFIVAISIILGVVFLIEMISFICTLKLIDKHDNKETILTSKSITNLKKTLLWITIIYYVLIFIFALFFLLKKIRKK